MITAIRYKDYSTNEEQIKREGLALVNIALTDADFEARWTNPNVICTESQGLTQLEILQRMRTDISIKFHAYRKWWSKVIGYFVSGNVVWDNLKYVDIDDATESGSNDIHEVAHVKTFTHDGEMDTSVPYTLNRIFEDWAYAYLAKKNAVAAPMATNVGAPLTAEEEHA